MKKTAALTVLSLAVSFFGLAVLSHAQTPPPSPPLSGPVGPIFMVEYSTDLPGGDLRPAYPVADFGQCMNDCANDPACRSFAFVKPYELMPARNNPGPMCCLKNTVPSKIMNPGVIAGIKQ